MSFSILLTCFLVYVRKLWGEVTCLSILGVEGLNFRQSSLIFIMYSAYNIMQCLSFFQCISSGKRERTTESS